MPALCHGWGRVPTGPESCWHCPLPRGQLFTVSRSKEQASALCQYLPAAAESCSVREGAGAGAVPGSAGAGRSRSWHRRLAPAALPPLPRAGKLAEGRKKTLLAPVGGWRRRRWAEPGSDAHGHRTQPRDPLEEAGRGHCQGQSWGHGDSPGWQNTREGVGRGHGMVLGLASAGVVPMFPDSASFPLGTAVCPSPALLPAASPNPRRWHREGSGRVPGSSGADPPQLPSYSEGTVPTSAPLLQSPGHSSHLCLPSWHRDALNLHHSSCWRAPGTVLVPGLLTLAVSSAF